MSEQNQDVEALIKADHREVERLFAAIRAVDGCDVDSGEFTMLVERLQREVTHHVQEEEGALLPALRMQVGDEKMADLGRAFKAAELTAPTRPHVHAPDTPPGNLIVGPVASVVDHLQHAISKDR